jgi:hypothetical protein
MNITFGNYMTNTEAVFKGCKIPKRAPDFISKSGSIYWQQENTKGKYVIRLSNHWVNMKKLGSNKVWKDCNSIASCKWHLKTNKMQSGCKMSGKCYLSDFKKIN